MNTPPIVSPEEWAAARQQLLVKEKEVTGGRDTLAAEPRYRRFRSGSVVICVNQPVLGADRSRLRQPGPSSSKPLPLESLLDELRPDLTWYRLAEP